MTPVKPITRFFYKLIHDQIFIYLTTLLLLYELYNVKFNRMMIKNGNQVTLCESVVANFKVSRNSPGDTEKYHGYPSTSDSSGTVFEPGMSSLKYRN